MALIEQMSHALNLPRDYLEKTASKASHCYKTYTIPKRSGGCRTIHHPARELKALQRWLLIKVLESLPAHEAAMGYRRRLSIKDNALRHVESRYLLRLDFHNFFPSLTSDDIRSYIASYRSRSPFCDWDSRDVDFFIAIVCRQGRLTIGSPTSPALSNALCFELDSKLTEISECEQVTYTRYADDLFFSTSQQDVLGSFPEKVEKILASLKIPRGLRINHSKIRHSSKKGRRRVTGITLGSDGKISIGRSLKRYIRRQVHLHDSLSPEDKVKLAGLIAYAQSVDPDIINSLVMKYGDDRVNNACRGL